MKIYTLFGIVTFMILLGCNNIFDDVEEEPDCRSPRIGSPVPYGSPIWHPNGEVIGFGHTPLKEIQLKYDGPCTLSVWYEWEYDSTGFWLMDADGTNERRIFVYSLGSPAWSPDGEWIAFEEGAQIYKMRFTGSGFDTTTVTQLTTVGRNFHPSWSPDGEWIAYDRSLPDSIGPAGVWIMKADGTYKKSVFGGAYPVWHPDGTSILAVIGTSPTSIWTRFVRFYPFHYAMSDTLSAAIGNDNSYPRYSPDGSMIAFPSQPPDDHVNICLMKADGFGLRQLTTTGTLDWLDWSPDGQWIVYVDARYDDISYDNGTIWIVNVQTGEKRQLTFNNPPDNEGR